MKVLDLVKILFDKPEMCDDEADFILWECTGYPSFLYGDRAKCLCRQIRHAKRALARGFTVDDIAFGQDRIDPSPALSTPHLSLDNTKHELTS